MHEESYWMIEDDELHIQLTKMKKGDMWTRAEDERIMSAVADHGLKWQEIAQQLPGRSAAAVQNRYLRLQKSQNIGP